MQVAALERMNLRILVNVNSVSGCVDLSSWTPAALPSEVMMIWLPEQGGDLAASSPHDSA